MPFKIERSTVFSRLYTRLKVKPSGESGINALSPEVQPITDVDALLREAKANTVTSGAATAGTSETKTLFTVPAGKRWRWFGIDAARASGDNTLESIGVLDTSENKAHFIARPGTATYTSGVFGTPMVLDQGDTIRLTSQAAGVAATTWGVSIWVEEEDAY